MESTSEKETENYNFSSNKDINLWIVTEGMAGTENQCLGIAEHLGVSNVLVKHIGLKFPFNLLCPHIIKKAPRWAIKNDDWPTSNDCDGAWPDIVLASGRKAVSASLSIPKAFKVFIQNPRIDPKYFDLVAIPAHDNVTGDNVIVTKGAPNRIHNASLQGAATRFKDMFSHLPERKIAIMIGGNSKTHSMPDNFAKILFSQLLPYLQSGECGVLITCSRRTPAHIQDQIASLFSTPNCYIWDGTGDNPYHAFLAEADALLVTEDSTSMLSDALTTGKPTYRLPLIGGSAKFDRLYASLENHGGLRVFEGELETWNYEPLNDAKMVADEIQKRFAIHAQET
ncbi:MAG: hypothetical protein COB76_04505 [Alphaproteobacteria bacterium]|nr:MAG: hypothetical protein COB76_04505 [Alphaproteobacteria bacterium]